MSDPVPGRADKSAGDAHTQADRERGSRATRPLGAVAVTVFVVVVLVAVGGIVYYVFR
jgi:hypothetical protein